MKRIIPILLLSLSCLWTTQAQQPLPTPTPTPAQVEKASGNVSRYDSMHPLTPAQAEKAEHWNAVFKTAPGAGPVNSGWERWEKYRSQYAKAKEADQGAVVFLGDSITFHFNAAKAFPNLKTANRGISGDTTRGMLYRLQEDVLDLHPKLIVLLCGVNDLSEAMVGHGGTPEMSATNVRLMLEMIQAKQAKTPVIVCEIMPAKKPLLKEANEAVDKVVPDFPNAHRLKWGAAFLNPDGKQNLTLFKDGTHPNEAGYAVWQAALEPELKKWLPVQNNLNANFPGEAL